MAISKKFFLDKILLIAILCFFPSYSFALIPSDFDCGRDLNLDGLVNACPSPDEDNDGYADNVDCDPLNAAVFPGISLQGSGPGTFKTCQSDGTFTPSAPISTYTCHSGSGSTYWVSFDQTDCTGTGTYASPKDPRCFFDSTKLGYHSPISGDCIVHKGGTYGYFFGTTPNKHMAYLSLKSGTFSNPITITSEPGIS